MQYTLLLLRFQIEVIQFYLKHNSYHCDSFCVIIKTISIKKMVDLKASMAATSKIGKQNNQNTSQNPKPTNSNSSSGHSDSRGNSNNSTQSTKRTTTTNSNSNTNTNSNSNTMSINTRNNSNSCDKQNNVCRKIVYASLLVATLVLIQQCDIISGQTASSTAIKDFQTDGISGPTKKCGPERHLEMDKCASNLGFLGDRTFIMPKNVSQMNGFCGVLTKSLKCIQTYARECLSSFPRQVLLTVTRNGRKQYNQLCENDSSKQEFVDKLVCLEPDNLEQLHQCMDGSIARFEYVANQVESDNRISAICCSYQIFRRDIDETVQKTCSNYPRINQTAQYLHEIISTTTGELIELVCGSYKTFEECKSKPRMANLVSTFTEITSKTKTKLIKPRAKSLISLFVNILNSF